MIVRKRQLPPGWYPQTPEEIKQFLEDYEAARERSAPVVMAPHAGWFYSGVIAARAISALDRDADTVVVIGGHLPAGLPPFFAEEDGVATPLGTMEIDREFREILVKELGGAGDAYQDNTVEIQLPMAAYFLPRARLIWLRLPAEGASFERGKRIAQIGMALGRKTVLIASTDLTHYGRNYGFMPHGAGKQALEWVKKVNDSRFIEAVEAGDPGMVLERAEGERAACSAGAVLGALGFAEARGLARGTLLAYGTSADPASREGSSPPDSFVGYAAMAWYGRL
ncbi:MAG: AmmeMemoRadiSam system protein B [Spirochaetaceae bacterium]|jgi:AmmeMemoRadiSam system protein B|nr:AmmeMemoRadiSam system protein B [Spirochaetaceae bacterium]